MSNKSVKLEDEDGLEGVLDGGDSKAIHAAFKQSVHSGPLPQADEFGKYESILPGAADRILSMAEKEQSSRLESQIKNDRGLDKQLDANIRIEGKKLNHANLGLILAFVIIVLLLAISAFCIYMDKDLVGSVLGLATLLAGYFIGGKDYLMQKASSTNEEE